MTPLKVLILSYAIKSQCSFDHTTTHANTFNVRALILTNIPIPISEATNILAARR